MPNHSSGNRCTLDPLLLENDTMKIKTSELTGTALDWAVAKCEGKNGVLHDDGITRCIVIAAASGVYKGTWKPSVNWSQCGPIIEREEIDLYCDVPTNPAYKDPSWRGSWRARYSRCGYGTDMYHGPTALIAAMRCYVASKLGAEVEIPNELIGE